MTSREYEILKILADGKFHSGQELADSINVSRTAIWKQLNKIREKQLDVRAIKGRGYQLSEPLELLQADSILKSISLKPDVSINAINILFSIDSTNQYLLDELSKGPIHSRVVLTEHQKRGRGRGINRWESGLGAGIYLSIGWQFALMPKSYSALSLAVGTVISNCISELSGKSIGLKWPNDLIYEGSKLGGILIESRGQLAGRMDTVIGIGLNINIFDDIRSKVNQDITDLKEVFGHIPSRNELAAKVISNIINLLTEYPDCGFAHYLQDWRVRDISRGKMARLNMAGNIIEGTVVDVDEQGNLIISVDGKHEKYTSGDLSLRMTN